ncbi:hypothetical protein [Krasilnikovia sp. MM14-A1259]|uniref:hypothetical protein n=1 Tax=Krasilnikovia sp. MM14-A1259 TaxID=3373539 RepID=UPI00399CEF6A
MELYFARKRIVALETENAALRSQLAAIERESALEAAESPTPPQTGLSDQQPTSS